MSSAVAWFLKSIISVLLLATALHAPAAEEPNRLVDDIYKLLGPNEAIVDIQPIGGGFANELWLVATQGGRYVMRAPHEYAAAETFERSLAVGLLAAEWHLAPPILAVDKHKQQTLMAYVSSEPWPLYQDAAEPFQRAMEVLRTWHDRLAPLAVDWPHAPPAPFAGIFERGDQLASYPQVPVHFSVARQRCQRMLACLQPWLEQHATLCHGDFHKGNVLLSAGDEKYWPLIIDFDTVVWGHPFFDVAKFSAGMAPQARWELLRSYLGRVPTSVDESHFELMDVALLMVVALVRYESALAGAGGEGDLLSKEQAEALLNAPELLPSFTSIPFGEQSPQMRQLGAIYALGEFLRRTETSDFEDALLSLL